MSVNQIVNEPAEYRMAKFSTRLLNSEHGRICGFLYDLMIKKLLELWRSSATIKDQSSYRVVALLKMVGNKEMCFYDTKKERRSRGRGQF